MLQVCGMILQITGVTNRASRGVSAMKQNEVPENVKVTACIARPGVSYSLLKKSIKFECQLLIPATISPAILGLFIV